MEERSEQCGRSGWKWRGAKNGVGLGNALQLPKEDLASAVQVFRADDITALLMGRNKEAAEMSKRATKRLREEGG